MSMYAGKNPECASLSQLSGDPVPAGLARFFTWMGWQQQRARDSQEPERDSRTELAGLNALPYDRRVLITHRGGNSSRP